jgi:hypothetical protein
MEFKWISPSDYVRSDIPWLPNAHFPLNKIGPAKQTLVISDADKGKNRIT